MEAQVIADTALLAQAFARGSAMKRDMLRVEGGVLSPDEFACRARLKVAELDEEPLLWLDIDGERVYPAFQIAGDGLLPGIGAVVEAFAIEEAWMRVNFMLTSDARLGGKRPVDALREGRISEVIEASQAYGEHGAA
ncbi:MAG: hypothetical protein ABS87_00060 [Sphingomonas sp. SCN 67-18]|uniref:Rv2175c family DNA-binding protein n=1 Tax=uncultured Sphingomonas sp. TaxID=158754 RepID=UPI0008686B81|nr:Rv2175c family DNA-binding protein [uncultured Sphingomonas sp.]ODU23005.1 MAG: hypothetical protein ABS87_00060 [Sphingomonas sp. SCN 67-18]